MIGPLGCCGQKTKKTVQGTRLNLEQKYKKIWRFNDEELFEFTTRFESQALNHKLSHKNYRESLGIIGIESLAFMCDRMFNVMDKDKDGYITLDEYLNYIDILLYGAEEEKLKQSFELLDEVNNGIISFQEFRKIVSSFAQMWSAALGQPTPINPKWIERIFNSLSQGKEFFDLNDFMREMRENPDMLFWFSKPEKAMNKRLNENLGNLTQKEQKMKEQILNLKERLDSYTSHVQLNLQSCLEVLSGVITPAKGHTGSIYGSPRDIGQEGNMRVIKTWQIPRNQLFMSVNHIPMQDIEFPNNIFDKNLSARNNYQNKRKNKRSLRRLRGSLGPNNLNQGATSTFDIIAEEVDKPITQEDIYEFNKKSYSIQNIIKDLDKKRRFSQTEQSRQFPSIILHRMDQFEKDNVLQYQEEVKDDLAFERDINYKIGFKGETDEYEGGEEDQKQNMDKSDGSIDIEDIQMDFNYQNKLLQNQSSQAIPDVLYKSNPQYPGQIFFIDCPEGNQQYVSEEDSYISSLDSQEEEEENFRIQQERTLMKKISELNHYLTDQQKKSSMTDVKELVTHRSAVQKSIAQNHNLGPGALLSSSTNLQEINRQSLLQKQNNKSKASTATIACQTDFQQQIYKSPVLNNYEVRSNTQSIKNQEQSILTFADINAFEKTKQRLKDKMSLEIDSEFETKYKEQRKKINSVKKTITQLLAFISDSNDQFESIFKQLLPLENDTQLKQLQVSQNVPKTLNIKKNKILKEQKSRQNIPENVKLIHPAHRNFNLVFNIMLGIKKAIDSTLDIPLLDVTEKDYKIRCHYELAPFRTDTKDNIKACTFFDYAPQIFASIRKTCGIKKQQYSNSLGPEHILGYMFNANFKTLAELCSSGKSGSFFYYTSDGKFVLKTISRNEFKFLKRILKNYHQYLIGENPDSLISKVLGLHKVIFYRKKGQLSKKIYFAIMNNVFNTHKKIDYRYDLKGSTQGRLTYQNSDSAIDPTIALKDLDFINRREKFKVGGEVKKKIADSIIQDAKFFARNQIIDYSLLVGVNIKGLNQSPTILSRINSIESDHGSPIQSQYGYNTQQERYSTVSISHTPLFEQCEQGIVSLDKSNIYFLGIIDILTEYNTKKKFEHAFKSIKYDSSTISCIPPDLYADRFINFIKDAFQ